MEDKPKVLILEDLQNWRDTISRLLILNDYDVVTADSLGTAMNLLQSKSFDVVIVDIRLNEGDVNNMDGIVFLDEIEKYYSEDRMHAIMLSGHATTKHAINALERPIKIVTKFFLKEEIDNDEFVSEVGRAVRITKGERDDRDTKTFRIDLSAIFYDLLDIPSLIQNLKHTNPDLESEKDFKAVLRNLLLSVSPLTYTVKTIKDMNEKDKLHLLLWSRKNAQAVGVTITLQQGKEPSGDYWDQYGKTEIIKRSSSKYYTGIAMMLQDMQFQEFLST